MSGMGLWSCWVGAVLAAEAIGIALAFGADQLSARLLGLATTLSDRLAEIGISVGVGAVEGVVLGSLQALVLRAALRRFQAGRWVVLTAAAGGLCWLLGMIPQILFQSVRAEAAALEPQLDILLAGATAMGLVLGVLIGLAQWLVLQRAVRRAWLWIPANALGWGIAMGWVFYGAHRIDAETPFATVVAVLAGCGALAGISVGAVTGGSLIWLRSRPRA